MDIHKLSVLTVLNFLLFCLAGASAVATEQNPTGSEKGYLGAMIQEFPMDLKPYYPEGQRQGVLIVDVLEGGPGQKAGLQKGDIIIAIDGQRVYDPQDVVKIISGYKSGDKPRIVFMRSVSPTLTPPPQPKKVDTAKDSSNQVPFEPVPFK